VQHEKMRTSLRGAAVHPREDYNSDEHSPPESRRQRVFPVADAREGATYDHPLVLCFAARNRRGRFYIPNRALTSTQGTIWRSLAHSKDPIARITFLLAYKWIMF
jgi:hypothetical protein